MAAWNGHCRARQRIKGTNDDSVAYGTVQREFNEYEQSEGRSVTRFERSTQDAETRYINEFLRTGEIEQRVETVTPPAFTNLNGNVGSLSPILFFNKVISSLRQHSPLFDPANVTYVETKSGAPIQLPWLSDVENVATIIGEGGDDSGSTDAGFVGGTFVKTYNYRTPRVKISYESIQDVDATPTLLTLNRLRNGNVKTRNCTSTRG